MATYNGERYIAEQLASIAGQTRPPDELVVCDDGSTDATVIVIDAFAERANITVRLHINPQRLGVRGNFERALGLCTGDVIFLSDQDDVWLPAKIETMLEILDRHPTARLAVNDMYLADERLRYQRTQLDQIRRVWRMSERGLVAGCGTVIRAELRDLALPIPEGMQHDIWLHALAEALTSRVVAEQPLQIYRRHETNHSQPLASAISRIGPWTQLRTLFPPDPSASAQQRLGTLRHVRQRYLDHATDPALSSDPHALSVVPAIEWQIALIEQRIQLLAEPRRRRFNRVWRLFHAGGYSLFSGYYSAAKDLVWKRPDRP